MKPAVHRVNAFSRILRQRCHFLGRSTKAASIRLIVLNHHSIIARMIQFVLCLAGAWNLALRLRLGPATLILRLSGPP